MPEHSVCIRFMWIRTRWPNLLKNISAPDQARKGREETEEKGLRTCTFYRFS